MTTVQFKDSYMDKTLQRLTFNFKPVVRIDQMEGQEYLVAPMVMLTEGVHIGSSGPLYYPAEELADVPYIWNHKPIVVYHPEKGGVGISACNPDILTNRKIGLIMNTRYEDGKLKAEAWLNRERMAQVDERVLESIENNEMLELSTGLYTDYDKEAGEWNGEEYKAIARNFRPDHLAILPDLKGACSIEDGAGFLRLNQDPRTERTSSWLKTYKPILEAAGIDTNRLHTNKLSHGKVAQQISEIMNPRGVDPRGLDAASYKYIEEVYDDFFIYEDVDNNLYKQAYKVVDDSIELEGERKEVVRVTEYRTKDDNQFVGNMKGDIIMGKEKIVERLIANELTKWTEEDKKTLMTLNEEVLEKMEPEAVEQETEESKPDETAQLNPEPEQNKAETAEEFIAKAPEELQSVLKNSLKTYKDQKQNLVDKILSNERNVFSTELLQNKEVDELQGIVALIRNEKKDSTKPNYAGQGDSAPIGNESAEEPLVAPVMNFGSDQK